MAKSNKVVKNEKYPIKVSYNDENGVEKFVFVRKCADFSSYQQTVNMIVSGLFNDEGDYIPEWHSYLEKCAYINLYVDYKESVDPDYIFNLSYNTNFFEAINEVVNLRQLSDALSAVKEMVIAKNNKSEVDIFFKALTKKLNELPTIDTKTLEKVIQNLSNMNIDENKLYDLFMPENAQ